MSQARLVAVFTAALALAPATSFAAPPVWENDVGAPVPGISNVDDDSTETGNPVTFGTFAFPFYGTSYTGTTHVTIASNGFLLLGTHDTLGDDNTPTGQEITTAAAPRIAPYWSDLITSDAPAEQGSVALNTFNDDGDPAVDRMVITWAANSFGCGNPLQAFPACANRAQVQLLENGTVIFGYDGLHAGQEPALVGVGRGSQDASADPGSRDFSALGYPVAIASPGYEFFQSRPLQVDLDQRNLVFTPVGAQGFTVTQMGGDVAVSMSGPASATAGDTVTYTATARNDGEAPVTGVRLVDALPAGAAFASAPGCTGAAVVTCELGTLAPGQSKSVTIAAAATQPGTLVNTVTARMDLRGDPAPNNSASVSTAVGEAPPPGGSTPGAPRPAPVASARVSGQKLGDLLKRGLRVAVTCDGACGIDVTATVSKADAARLKLKGRTLGSASDERDSAGTSTLSLKVKRKAAKRARRLSRLPVKVEVVISGETGEAIVKADATLRP